jgi:hypothetical protein
MGTSGLTVLALFASLKGFLQQADKDADSTRTGGSLAMIIGLGRGC